MCLYTGRFCVIEVLHKYKEVTVLRPLSGAKDPQGPPKPQDHFLSIHNQINPSGSPGQTQPVGPFLPDRLQFRTFSNSSDDDDSVY